ncbi:MAG TPA: PadR family transcriptional regulator [Candidatus Acidoferrales bacterium]|nr:PadR family transcriptional regulator [Candidatus Acidoferrales bacterium]
MDKDKKEFLKGTLDMLILKIVAFGPIHGYAISQRMKEISKDFFQVHQGSLYPALHRLEDRGWLEPEWKESETGREAKFYKLTRKGRKQLENEVESWARMSDAVKTILRAVE